MNETDGATRLAHGNQPTDRHTDETHDQARALREELRLLREGEEVATELAAMSRVDAIVEVLRRAGAPLSQTEIREGLVAAGRPEDSRQVISATLSYLVQRGRVMRVGRGQYAAAV